MAVVSLRSVVLADVISKKSQLLRVFFASLNVFRSYSVSYLADVLHIRPVGRKGVHDAWSPHVTSTVSLESGASKRMPSLEVVDGHMWRPSRERFWKVSRALQGCLDLHFLIWS